MPRTLSEDERTGSTRSLKALSSTIVRIKTTNIRIDYKNGTMKLIHPEILKIRDRDWSKEKGSHKTILPYYHYLPTKSKVELA